MDFVVVGLGLGALAVLAGLALRDLGPRRWIVRQDDALPVAEVARRVRRARTCRATGITLALAGALVWGITVLSLVAQVSDEHGDMLVLSAFVIAAATIGIWALLYRRFATRLPGQGPFLRPRARRRASTSRPRPAGRRSRVRGAGPRPAATGRAAHAATAAGVRHAFDAENQADVSPSEDGKRAHAAHHLPDLPFDGSTELDRDEAAADGAVKRLMLPALPDLEDDEDSPSLASRTANSARRAL